MKKFSLVFESNQRKLKINLKLEKLMGLKAKREKLHI